MIHAASYANLHLNKTGKFTLADKTTVEATNITLGTNASLEIDCEQAVKISNKLINPKGKDGILIKADRDKASGTLIFKNDDTERISATIEMHAYGSWERDGATGKITDPKWQYFGIPFHELGGIEHVFYGSIIRRHNEAGELNNPANPKWVHLYNADKLYPLVGYEITQASAKKYSFSGELYNKDIILNLSYTEGVDYSGQNILSNPYMAAIDISKITFTNTDEKVYVYKSGRLSDWKERNTDIESDEGALAGQYIASPKTLAGTASIPKEIPPMQGFLVKARGANASIEVNYADVMKASRSQRAPETPKPWLRMHLQTEEAGGDVLWLFSHPETTRGYDNGWDGLKMIGDADLPLLYSRNETGNYQINAQRDIHNTDIAFKAGTKSETYTITFHNGGGMTEQYDKIYLEDKHLGLLIDITEDGTTYHFRSNDTVGSNRFKVLASKDGSDISEGTTDVYVYTSGHNLVMENHGKFDSRIELYDSVGRFVAIFHCPAGAIQTEQLSISGGSYIARVISGGDERVMCRKVVIGG